jgi:hypothetical protein
MSKQRWRQIYQANLHGLEPSGPDGTGGAGHDWAALAGKRGDGPAISAACLPGSGSGKEIRPGNAKVLGLPAN